MNTVQLIQFNNFKHAVEGNMLDNVKRLMPQIKVIEENSQDEELQYLYHMALAAICPQECVETYKNRFVDKYWLPFWACVAFHKLGDVHNAEKAKMDLGRWQGLIPSENMFVLTAICSFIERDKDMSSGMLTKAVSGWYSTLLAPAVDAMSSVINNDSNLAALYRNKFYVDNFFDERNRTVDRTMLNADKNAKGTINGHEWVDLGLPSGLK